MQVIGMPQFWGCMTAGRDGPSDPHLLLFTPLCSPLSQYTSVGLCDQQNRSDTMSLLKLNDIVIYYPGDCFSFKLLALGNASCHINSPMEKPTL